MWRFESERHTFTGSNQENRSPLEEKRGKKRRIGSSLILTVSKNQKADRVPRNRHPVTRTWRGGLSKEDLATVKRGGEVVY